MKTIGISYFETHPQMEKGLLPIKMQHDHVIVDKEDYEEVLRFLQGNQVTVEMIRAYKQPRIELKETKPVAYIKGLTRKD